MYEPRQCTATDAVGVALWALQELTELARVANDGSEYAIFQPLAKAPAAPREGMLINADGTHFNPGAGAGLYQYLGAAWVKL